MKPDHGEHGGGSTIHGPATKLALVSAKDLPGLRTLEINTGLDLLNHAPSRYEDELAESSVGEALAAVAANPKVIIQLHGSIGRVRVIRGRTSRVDATLECGDRPVRLVWFRTPWIAKTLHPGVSGLVRGKAKATGEYLELINPTWEPEEGERTARTGSLRPVYPATDRLTSARIAQLVDANLDQLCRQVRDPLGAELRSRLGLVPLADAFHDLHAPATRQAAANARMRLAFDELLVLQLAIAMRRWQVQHDFRAPILTVTPAIETRILARLPFALTAVQLGACRELASDLGRDRPMNRLLQGDVGSGKTAVAVYGMLAAVAHGHQAALIAPTEILAEQHYRSVSRMLAGTDVSVVLLSGGRSGAGKAAVRSAIVGGAAHIAVGTHALLGDQVTFHSLALAVVDEQHRFGVEQRAKLRGQGGSNRMPHVLVMTATPIPRTMALAFLGDLDVTNMRGRLPGRTEVATRVLPSERAGEAYAYLRKRIDQGERAYVIVPAVEESAAGLKDVRNHAEFLQSGAFKGIRIGQLHGRMKPAERDESMGRFASGEDQVLVATVVVEVGIDVPEATLMIVEHAERFGLAQLHQLRGRIGRGSKPSLCVFIGDPVTPDATGRLEAIASTTDGFRIGEMDLSLRGPGEAIGQRQSGLPPFKVADLGQDFGLLETAREEAQRWIAADPMLRGERSTEIRRTVLNRYGNEMGLAGVG